MAMESRQANTRHLFSRYPTVPAAVAHQLGLLLLWRLCAAEPQASHDQPNIILSMNSTDIVNMFHNRLRARCIASLFLL